MSSAQKEPKVEYQTDVDGYMLHPEQWTREIGGDIARKEGIHDMTDRHWQAIDCVRAYFDRYDGAPRMHSVTQGTGFDGATLAQLFPPHALALVSKIAGLPNPRPVAGYDKTVE
jgi:tRNA 2-thiouridine synthesizing protein E